ncbi:MAG: protein phosphatase 2C domain-containing protein, partial [Synergistota bacterium]|nr:protein phosphatase 2C domain-containing protein [Synergistota bacterium]
MHLSVYTAQAQGARKRQEDRTAVETTKEMTVAVLADGMGGMPMGAEAAEETVRTITAELREQSAKDPRQMLLDAARRADGNVTRLGTRFGFPGLCGSTLVCVLALDDLVWWLSVGDSRIYLYRKGDLALLTTDHATGYTGALTSFIGGMSQICIPAEPMKPEA